MLLRNIDEHFEPVIKCMKGELATIQTSNFITEKEGLFDEELKENVWHFHTYTPHCSRDST